MPSEVPISTPSPALGASTSTFFDFSIWWLRAEAMTRSAQRNLHGGSWDKSSTWAMETCRRWPSASSRPTIRTWRRTRYQRYMERSHRPRRSLRTSVLVAAICSIGRSRTIDLTVAGTRDIWFKGRIKMLKNEKSPMKRSPTSRSRELGVGQQEAFDRLRHSEFCSSPT